MWRNRPLRSIGSGAARLHRRPGRHFSPIMQSMIAAIDFFTVPTLTFRNLYCFIILLHDRRQVVYFNVTAHPTAEWTARQIIEAFPEDSAPRYLLRDRDQIYGEEFRLRVQ